MISNCGGDERGKIGGGVAGDQTKKEWRVTNWYDRPWYCVLRHPDANVRETIAKLGRAAAENDNIGYDQWERLTFFKKLQEANWDPSSITDPCETDCSAGTTACVIAAGNILGNPNLASLDPNLVTQTMRKAYVDAGFELIKDKKYRNSDKYLLPGDILLNDDKHTAINLDAGSETVASEPIPEPSPVPAKSITELANEVIRGDWGNGQERIDRLTSAGYNAAEIQNEVNRILGVGQAPSSTKFRVINVNSYLNVRSGPGTNYASIGKLYNGDIVEVSGSVETRNGFTKIALGKWVGSNYITKV